MEPVFNQRIWEISISKHHLPRVMHMNDVFTSLCGATMEDLFSFNPVAVVANCSGYDK